MRHPVARRRLGPKEFRKIAKERIDQLFALAGEEAKAGKEARARRYVELARRLGTRHNVSVPYKRQFCKQCNTYLIPAKTSSVRLRHRRMVIRCLRCGALQRLPYPRGRRIG